MEILVTKNQALEISHALITGEKERNDYGHMALKEAGMVIDNMLQLDGIEQELTTLKEPESVKEAKPLTIVDLEKNLKKF
tara:strand:- start:548 stop:787 length:240 start_codon:yes stop_codon:yes gene_type:complete